MRPEQALARLLSGSGLHYSFSDPRSVVISGRSASAGMTAPDGSILLDTITLNASGAATEGSGS
ncbi:STN domain-containing protein [Paracoccus sp. pheM1]|nr:STN domain-containing protein [Paracoccus sp. pheM1]